jgi:2-dehydropantoate 2-reductase
LLAQTGHEVNFIARGENLQALRAKGLHVKSVHGDFTIQPVQATDDPGEVGPVDYVVVAVKHYQLKQTAPAIAPLVGDGTTVVPLLNGVEAPEILAGTLSPESVVGGLCSLVSLLESPGVIRQESGMRRVVVGELDRSRSDRVERLVQAWAASGAEAIHAEDISAAMWSKLVFIASFGGVGSLARCNMGQMLSTPETRTLFIEAMREIDAVARARGIQLAPNEVDKRLAMAEGFEPTATSSMSRDVAAGNPFELDASSGTVVRMGESAGVPTPIHRTIYALLKPALVAAMGGD